MRLNLKIDWGVVLKIDTLMYNSQNRTQQKRRIQGLIDNVFFKRPDIHIEKSKKYLFFKSMFRSDYNKQFEDISNVIDDKCIVDIEYKASVIPRGYPIYIFLRYLPLLLKVNYSNDFKKMFYLMLCSIKYLEIARIVFNIDFKYLVVFADMQGIDNLLCQIAKQNSIPTVTLQHGLYVDYGSRPNINVVNYENHVADYFLAWGDDTKELIEKYHVDTKVIIVGKNLEKKEVKEIKDYFTVVFDQNIFHEYNKSILKISYEIAKKMNLKINLRLHPNNKISWYQIDENVIIQDHELANSKFIVGHTTSILYELMRLGLPVYKFRSDILANELDDKFKFSTISELESKIQVHNEMKYNFSEYAERYIKYIGNESLELHKNFFIRLEHDK